MNYWSGSLETQDMDIVNPVATGTTRRYARYVTITMRRPQWWNWSSFWSSLHFDLSQFQLTLSGSTMNFLNCHLELHCWTLFKISFLCFLKHDSQDRERRVFAVCMRKRRKFTHLNWCAARWDAHKVGQIVKISWRSDQSADHQALASLTFLLYRQGALTFA